MTLESDFWRHVDRSAGSFECWPWTAKRQPFGYGQLAVNGTNITAHRHAYQLIFGRVPDSLCVCHHCDNPPCCNPAHLWLGTHRENATDRTQKGRNSLFSREKNGSAKLTSEQVSEIRSRAASGESHRQIARDFPVCHQHIGKVITRETWQDVPTVVRTREAAA